jgi:hypothetical protein
LGIILFALWRGAARLSRPANFQPWLPDLVGREASVEKSQPPSFHGLRRETQDSWAAKSEESSVELCARFARLFALGRYGLSSIAVPAGRQAAIGRAEIKWGQKQEK